MSKTGQEDWISLPRIGRTNLARVSHGHLRSPLSGHTCFHSFTHSLIREQWLNLTQGPCTIPSLSYQTQFFPLGLVGDGKEGGTVLYGHLDKIH